MVKSSRNKYVKKSRSISEKDNKTLKLDKKIETRIFEFKPAVSTSKANNHKYINVLDFVSNPSHNQSKLEDKTKLSGSSQDYFLVSHNKKMSKDKRSNSQNFNIKSNYEVIVDTRHIDLNNYDSQSLQKYKQEEPIMDVDLNTKSLERDNLK